MTSTYTLFNPYVYLNLDSLHSQHIWCASFLLSLCKSNVHNLWPHLKSCHRKTHHIYIILISCLSYGTRHYATLIKMVTCSYTYVYSIKNEKCEVLHVAFTFTCLRLPNLSVLYVITLYLIGTAYVNIICREFLNFNA